MALLKPFRMPSRESCESPGGFKWLAQSGRLAMGQGLFEASGSIAKPNRKPYGPLQPLEPNAAVEYDPMDLCGRRFESRMIWAV